MGLWGPFHLKRPLVAFSFGISEKTVFSNAIDSSVSLMLDERSIVSSIQYSRICFFDYTASAVNCC
jgi:hypothetical protein